MPRNHTSEQTAGGGPFAEAGSSTLLASAIGAQAMRGRVACESSPVSSRYGVPVPLRVWHGIL